MPMTAFKTARENALVREVRTRIYAGLSATQRSDGRRARLLAAARECYGTVGLRRTTIPQLCSEAGVTARHFYELFETQETLLRAVYDEICAEVLAAIAPEMSKRGSAALRIRRCSRAYFAFVTADARRARIFALEWIDVGAAIERREQAIREIFITATHDAKTAPLDIRLLAVSLVGMAKALTAEWVMSKRKPKLDAMSDHLATVWSRALKLREASG
jgi:AcrR family transcriptional regulator